MLMQMIKRDNSVMINDIVKHIVRNKEQHAYSIANNLFNKNTPYYIYTPHNEVRGGILELPCPSVCL